MRSVLRYAFLPILLAGCINGDFNQNDQGVSTPPDMTAKIFDIAGVDLYGAYNCVGLNTCERACTTPACVFMCQSMATPSAKSLDSALQGCFNQFCPSGAGQVCDASSGMVSAICMMCISNTYIPKGMSCQASQMVSECHQCVDQANACTADM
ncbi:MAG TPA: hypothetical protein VN947_29025 [Polyangia bacterium]|nr:hypothetical protein [Polyangia bacterium]